MMDVAAQIAVILVLLLLGAPALAGGAPLSVRLKSHVTMTEEDIRVRDILEPNETDLEFTRRYGDLLLTGLKPEAERLDHGRLVGLLAAAGADLNAIRFVGSAGVEIERGQKIPLTSDVVSRIAGSVAKAGGLPSGDVLVEWARILPRVPEDGLDFLRFKGFDADDLSDLDRARFIASVQDENGDIRRHAITAKLTVETAVATAAEIFEAGRRIGEKDIVTGRVPLEGLPGRLISSADIAAKPFKAIAEIAKGDILFSDLLREAEEIKEGSPVTISYKTEHLDIRATGTLIESAEIGEIVRAENGDSKRTVKGRLVARDLVEVSDAL